MLLGELHVPGFSDHIQPLDEKYLLTIGSDADEMTGRMGGLQVSILMSLILQIHCLRIATHSQTTGVAVPT